MSKEQPTKWVLGWSGDIEIGFDDGTFLPRKAALILYPEYFDEEGNPIKEKLPFAKPKTENKKNVFAEFIAKYLTVKDIKRIDRQTKIEVWFFKLKIKIIKAFTRWTDEQIEEWYNKRNDR